MLSSQTCCMVCDFFISLARTEKKLEVIRQLLAEESEFEAYAVYKRIDRNINQFLTAKEIQNFLQDNGISFAAEVIANSYIAHYDIDKDKGLVFSEFLRSVLPFDNPNLRSICTQRPTYDVGSNEFLSADIECILARFFENEINAFLELEPMKQNIKNQGDFSVDKLFAQIDSDNNGYLDFDNIMNFFSINDYYPYEEEIISILRNFDKDDDGRLTIQDFADGILPKYFKSPEIQKAQMQPNEKKLTSQAKFSTPSKKLQSGFNMGSASKNQGLSPSRNKYPFEPLRKPAPNSPLKGMFPPQKPLQQAQEDGPKENALQTINKMKEETKKRMNRLDSSMTGRLQASQMRVSQQHSQVKSIESPQNMISPASKIKTFY